MPDEEKKSIELMIKEQLEINGNDVLGELQRQSSHYFYYGTMWCKAARAKERQKLRVKETEARLTNELRQDINRADPKGKVTESMKHDYLYSNQEYLDEETDLLEAEYREDMLDIAKEAFRQRAQALQELARQQRESSIYGEEFSNMKKEFAAREEENLAKKVKKNVTD